jgi:hypothetical protein
MKFSEMMLAGYAKVEGRQTRGTAWRDAYGHPTADTSRARSACVIGAINLGGGGCGFNSALDRAWGVSAVSLNDDGMPWEHIYGMAVAAGL